MKKLELIIVLVFWFFISGFSQETEISGKVTNEKGDPLEFVTIAIKGCFDGTSSDEHGNYRFKTTEQGQRVLSVSYIGYQPVIGKIIGKI